MTKVVNIRREFASWSDYVTSLGFTDFVTPEDGFETELLSGTTWSNAKACGIYAWITEDGQAYVGQAVNVRNRLRQHWKNYRDIAYASFQPVPETELNEHEAHLIKKVERRYPILNIKLAQSSASLLPFDQVVSPGERELFLRGKERSPAGQWQNWPLLEMKQQRSFSVFAKMSAHRQFLKVLRTYIERCIPEPTSTEVKFWSVTNLYSKSEIFRVNVGQQEIFTLWDDGNNIFARTLARKKLSDDFDGPLWQTDSYASYIPISDFDNWLVGTHVLECRELAVWLMRHTVPMNSGSHCPQLVRAAFAAT